jgi:hypothetical protein
MLRRESLIFLSLTKNKKKLLVARSGLRRNNQQPPGEKELTQQHAEILDEQPKRATTLMRDEPGIIAATPHESLMR